MKTMQFIVSGFLGLAVNAGVFAQGLNDICEQFDLNSITYIEEEAEVELGFNTADYLPEGFDPNEAYVDLNAITFVEETVVYVDLSYLPQDFNAYGVPSYFRNIDYVDPTDECAVDFDSSQNLPEGFDPFEPVANSTTISL